MNTNTNPDSRKDSLCLFGLPLMPGIRTLFGVPVVAIILCYTLSSCGYSRYKSLESNVTVKYTIPQIEIENPQVFKIFDTMLVVAKSKIRNKDKPGEFVFCIFPEMDSTIWFVMSDDANTKNRLYSNTKSKVDIGGMYYNGYLILVYHIDSILPMKVLRVKRKNPEHLEFHVKERDDYIMADWNYTREEYSIEGDSMVLRNFVSY